MTTQPNPYKRQHPPTPIGKLLNKYAISLQDIRQCLIEENVRFKSRSTLNRIVHLKASNELIAEIYPKLVRCLGKFLTARGLDSVDITKELTAVFDIELIAAFKGDQQPMINQRIELRPDEYKWFGLTKDPFTPFPQGMEDVFISPPFQRVIDRVFDALQYPAFLAVTGEIGSGKDVLRAMVEDKVAKQTNFTVVWPEFMNQAKINETHIARAFLRNFGYGRKDSPNRIPGRVEELGNELKLCLEREFRAGNRITLAINECHHLNDTALSSLKNFFEMGSGGFQRWLSVLLIGQPSFAATSYENGKKIMRGRIFSEQFREIAERIVLVEMPSGNEFFKHAAEYLRFRLARAGAAPDLFDDDAIAYIARQATTPQQLGNIANEALRISREDFNNQKVIGAAIATKMHFAAPVETGNFTKRAA